MDDNLILGQIQIKKCCKHKENLNVANIKMKENLNVAIKKT